MGRMNKHFGLSCLLFILRLYSNLVYCNEFQKSNSVKADGVSMKYNDPLLNVVNSEEDDSVIKDNEYYRLKVHSEGYPPLASVRYYPWDYIVEAFKKTIIRIPDALLSDKYYYEWIIREADTDELHRFEGPVIEFTFTSVSKIYDVSFVVIFDNIVRHTETHHMICKYVRREIRDLLDEDREAYFRALGIVAKGNPTAFDAERMLKPEEKSFQYFMVKHIHFGECSPFHNANSFFTGHNAFTLELDQAMQAHDPRVIQPYWDYTIDSGLYGNDWYLKSPIFRDDWYGVASPQHDDRHVSTTWIDRIDNAVSWEAPTHNSFGIVTINTNENPSLSVSRTHSFCGFENRIPLPGCLEMGGCLRTRNLGALRMCLDTLLHRDLHMTFGGVWDCHVDLAGFAEKWPETQHLLARLGMKTVSYANVFWVNKILRCPLECDMGTRFEDCRCTCPEIDIRIKENGGEIDWTEAYDIIEAADPILDKLGPLLRDTPLVCADGKERYLFEDLSDLASQAIWKMILDLACHPGQLGTMCTGSSPGDPIFWPLHPVFDRISMFMRLNPDGQWDDFDWTWVDDDSDCYGHKSYDAMPFYNLFNEDDSVEPHFYSNLELMEMFDPKNPNVPYVYDNFDWAHCVKGTTPEVY